MNVLTSQEKENIIEILFLHTRVLSFLIIKQIVTTLPNIQKYTFFKEATNIMQNAASK